MSYANYNYGNHPSSPGYASRRTSTTSSQATSTSGQSRTISSNDSSTSSFIRDTFTLPSSSPTIIARPSSSNTFTDMPSVYSFDPLDIIDDLNYEDVDDGLIDHEMLHRRRETIVQELFVSEQKYLESLETICNQFLQPLTQTTKSSALKLLSNKKPICTEREARWLFGNIVEILNIHKETLAIFEERLRIWGPTQIISDVFQAWFQKLGAYNAYLDNYSVAVTTYERLTRYQPFKKFIDNAHKDPQLNGKTLLTLLQAPAGCITRYVQLLSKLFEATSPMHPDYAGLRASKQRITDIFGQMNKKIMDIQNVDHVLRIHQSLVGAPFGVKADRRLVLQDVITKSVTHSRTTEDERAYILFSDMLVIAKPKPDNTLHYKETINLEGATIRAELDYGIEITSPFQGVDTLNTTFVGSSTVHTFYTHNVETQQKWIRRLELVIESLSRARAKAKLAAANKSKARSTQGNYLQ